MTEFQIMHIRKLHLEGPTLHPKLTIEVNITGTITDFGTNSKALI